ncbi:MAG: GDSL-type esterase/lipase family protein [Kiritimatiellia bacterium]
MKTIRTWMTLAAICSAILAQAGTVLVSCAGDSITAGVGVADPGKESYPAQLGTLLGEGYEVRNFGVGGRTLARKADSYAFSPALNSNPDILICLLGTNDTKAYCAPYREAFVEEYVTQLNLFKKRNPAVKLLLGLPPTVHISRWGINEPAAKEIRALVREVAEKVGAEVVDFEVLLREKPECFADGIHPNAKGYRSMAERAAEEVRRISGHTEAK